MRTITIDLLNDKAINLLLELELLKLIRVHKDQQQKTAATNWLQFKGAMSKQPIEKINKQLEDLRNEWE